MKLHDLVPGTPGWHEHRLTHFNASEAAAMLGLSPHIKRNELLRMKHSGNPQEFTDWFQKNILDNGHAVETLARPIAEKIIGEELYPSIFSQGKLSVSCDGLTMDGTTAFEHKQWNRKLRDAVIRGVLPDEHQPQCQQAMMVTGATRLLFVVSDGTTDGCAYMWVEPDDEWRKRILQGWAQFAEDLANYAPPTDAPAVVASPIESLPALTVQVEGKVLSTNLNVFRTKAMAFIEKIKTDLQTDQDFADAEQMGKFLKDGEDKLEAVKDQALAQTATIYDLFSTIDHLREEMRSKRLTLEKAVKTRKDSIRIEILNGGVKAIREHVDGLNRRIGKPYMPDQAWADFGGVMKGKKTITSLRDAVDTELARAKITANEIADRIQINLNCLRDLAGDHKMLFADAAQLVLKDNDAVVAIIKQRIAEHDEAERKRRDTEAAKVAPPAPVAPPAVWPAQSAPIPPNGKPAAATEPTGEEIIEMIMQHYMVPREKVIGWLLLITSNTKPAEAQKRKAVGGKRK